jgi:hypothetical protein
MARRPRSEPAGQVSNAVTSLYDADGQLTSNPADAVRGEIIERDSEGKATRRAWFLIDEVELEWLPISELSFLLWVLALFVCAWIAIAVVILRFN